MDSRMLSGTLDMMALQVVSRSPTYGYQIAQAVMEKSKGYFEIKEGSLYPALHRLERQKLLASYWVETEESRRRKYYKITGAGENFCAGVDLSSFGELPEGEEHPFESSAKAVANFGKPLVAAVRGIAIGGGATILFHADICYVGESLRMRLPFANLGLVPEFASSYMLQANIGAQQAAELFYTAEWIDANRALECGIAARSFSDEELLEAALAKAREIAQWPVNALKEIKATLRLPHQAHIDAAFSAESAAMERQAGSPENIEAIMAFMEKRPAKFR